jgi:hypothetical protein
MEVETAGGRPTKIGFEQANQDRERCCCWNGGGLIDMERPTRRFALGGVQDGVQGVRSRPAGRD